MHGDWLQNGSLQPALSAALWGGLVLFSLGLSFLLWTRWGKYHLTGKCVVLSVLVHLLLGVYLATANVVVALNTMTTERPAVLKMERVEVEPRVEPISPPPVGPVGGQGVGAPVGSERPAGTPTPWDLPVEPITVDSPALRVGPSPAPAPETPERTVPEPPPLPQHVPDPELVEPAAVRPPGPEPAAAALAGSPELLTPEPTPMAVQPDQLQMPVTISPPPQVPADRPVRQAPSFKADGELTRHAPLSAMHLPEAPAKLRPPQSDQSKGTRSQPAQAEPVLAGPNDSAPARQQSPAETLGHVSPIRLPQPAQLADSSTEQPDAQPGWRSSTTLRLAPSFGQEAARQAPARSPDTGTQQQAAAPVLAPPMPSPATASAVADRSGTARLPSAAPVPAAPAAATSPAAKPATEAEAIVQPPVLATGPQGPKQQPAGAKSLAMVPSISLRRRFAPRLTDEQPARPQRSSTGSHRGQAGPTAPAAAPSPLTAPSTNQPLATHASGKRLPAATPVTTDGSGGTLAARTSPVVTKPEIYRGRTEPDRDLKARARGATPESEQAVERALRWLAAHQDRDGHWSVAGFYVHCPPRDQCFGPGNQTNDDVALTGLVLLAYLGAGHTHLDGQYAANVAAGIDWLLRMQRPNGDLRGPGRMYSHALATLALGEALGMTADQRLRDPVRRAVQFIVAAQHPVSGGWRYKPGMYGDTSIYGWQVMALKSAALAGVPVPKLTWQRARGWLALVGHGKHRGLASYLPNEVPTPAMTAEAMACRLFLGFGLNDPAVREAADYLMDYLPQWSRRNLYYWYYGTLATYLIAGSHWERWNGAMRDALVARQRRQGHAAGSWDPVGDPWGPEGGRVYTTALATLCLEIYYRYLPIQSLSMRELYPAGPPTAVGSRTTDQPSRR